VLSKVESLQTVDENAVRAIVVKVLEQQTSLRMKEIPSGDGD
jgi:hypothetical protein